MVKGKMFHKILVTLDGSKEAESALPYLRDLAMRFGSHVDVLGVGIGKKERRVNRLLEEYINRVVVSLCDERIEAQAVSLYGSSADKILDYITQGDVDLLIMATHGRGGISRWWMGSVAEKVISEVPTPVLLVRSERLRKTRAAKKSPFMKILAPLDGSDIGEAALSYVEALAMETGASLSLLQIISPPGTVEASVLGGHGWRKFVKAMNDASETYLSGVTKRLEEKGIETAYEVLTGDPADKIIEYIEDKEIGLIAMSTHGRSGIARWVLGSVADKVLHEAKMPMLLARSPKVIVPRPKGLDADS